MRGGVNTHTYTYIHKQTKLFYTTTYNLLYFQWFERGQILQVSVGKITKTLGDSGKSPAESCAEAYRKVQER